MKMKVGDIDDDVDDSDLMGNSVDKAIAQKIMNVQDKRDGNN